ncbi:glycosyltransferase family 2 protein [Polynucleobacter paneuropaeus]|nr:glycosyltransferase family 2 protein [Polynucleobacter paneuropaeus]
MDISVVIPVYQAEGCIAELYLRLITTLESMRLRFEIIMIEDCGTDNSWGIIQELASTDTRLRGFKLSRNFGQHNALTAGLDLSRGRWTVIMDCDLQDKPEDIKRLIEKTHEGFDVVIARNTTIRKSFIKQISAKIFYSTFSWCAGFRYEDGVRSFRIMSRDAVNALTAMRELMRSIGPLGIWIGFSSSYLHVALEPRFEGKSSYSLRRLLSLAFHNIVAFSDKPLQISVSIGFIMAGCALIYGSYIIIRATLHGIPVPGWSSLITSMYFIGGLILANLGVIGVYLGKTFEETKRRPLYLIARSTESSNLIEPLPLDPKLEQ